MKVDGSTHRGTATPRWDWSGVDQLIAPTISDGDMARVVESLPACRSTPEEIKSKIQALGARYHRYLHQDEFGPRRAEKMSALQAMQTAVGLLESLIVNLPQHLALELTYGTTEPDQSSLFGYYAVGPFCVVGLLSRSMKLRAQSWHGDTRFIQQMTCTCWRKSLHGPVPQSKWRAFSTPARRASCLTTPSAQGCFSKTMYLPSSTRHYLH